MIFSIFMLITALSLSAVSAYYSIMGLTAIFAAAVIPITIMGIVLEISKIVVTLWCHRYWEETSLRLKIYLVPAVLILMMITSLGTFGFLSKSHLDQAVPSGDIQSQVSLYDEKIQTERDNIETARKALAQMDASVDQIMGRTTDEQGASKASNLRRSQARERNNLSNDIDKAQKKIEQLQIARAPIASKARKVEADVGPIRYVAALLYGNKTNDDMLEAAVRMVIIIIVIVFDPLAIVMLLAATTSIDWSKLNRRKEKLEKLEDAKLEADIKDQLEFIDHTHHTEEHVQKMINDAIATATAKCESEHAEKWKDYEPNELMTKARQLAEAEYEVKMEHFKLDECNKCVAHIDKDIRLANEVIDLKLREHSEAEEEILQLTRSLHVMTAEVNELAPLVNTLETECAVLVTRDEEIQNEVQKLLDEMDALQDEKKNLEIKLLSSTDTAQLNALSETLIQIQSEKAELEQKIVDLNNDSSIQMMGSMADNDAERDSLTSKFNDKITALEEELRITTEIIESIQTEKESLEKQVADNIIAFSNIGDKLDELQNEFTAKEEEAATSAATINDLTITIDRLTTEIKSKISEIDSSNAMIVELNSQVISLKEDIVKLNTQLVEANATIRALKDEIDDMHNKAKERELTITRQKNEMVELREQIANNVKVEAIQVEQPKVELIVEDIPKVASAPIPTKRTIEVPNLSAMPDNFPMGGNASFGTTFPGDPIKGDLFLRVDFMPSKLFKFSGSNWITVDKTVIENFAFDEQYVKLLVDKISSGEYDIDSDLSETEREQVAKYLKNNPT